MSFEDLPCQDFVELATDYLDGRLTTEQRMVVELHLAFCEPCVDYVEQMRAAIRVTGTLREDDIPSAVMQPLVAAFRELHGDPS